MRNNMVSFNNSAKDTDSSKFRGITLDNQDNYNTLRDFIA